MREKRERMEGGEFRKHFSAERAFAAVQEAGISWNGRGVKD